LGTGLLGRIFCYQKEVFCSLETRLLFCFSVFYFDKFFLIVLSGGYIVTFTKVLTIYQVYPPFSFISPPSTPPPGLFFNEVNLRELLAPCGGVQSLLRTVATNTSLNRPWSKATTKLFLVGKKLGVGIAPPEPAFLGVSPRLAGARLS
jgi:hypothetical protein